MHSDQAPAVMQQPAPVASDTADWIRGLLGRRIVLLALAASAVAAGLAFGWEWLAALGVLPLLISLLPCLAMCALGLCMMKKGGQSCSKSNGADTAKSS